MKLNTTSDIPLFEQLKNDLLEQIKKRNLYFRSANPDRN